MQVLADCGLVQLVVIHSLILVLATSASAFQEEEFREFTLLSVDTVTEPAGDQGGHGRTKPPRPNDTRGKIAASRGEPTAYRHDSSHCKNGGTGFLRTFCFCETEFTGRYCEHRRNKSCDTIGHGEMVYRNCSYCWCMDGVLECRIHELVGCRDIPVPGKWHEQEVALDEVQPSSGGVPHGSTLGLVACLVVAVLTIHWLQPAPVR